MASAASTSGAKVLIARSTGACICKCGCLCWEKAFADSCIDVFMVGCIDWFMHADLAPDALSERAGQSVGRLLKLLHPKYGEHGICCRRRCCCCDKSMSHVALLLVTAGCGKQASHSWSCTQEIGSWSCSRASCASTRVGSLTKESCQVRTWQRLCLVGVLRLVCLPCVAPLHRWQCIDGLAGGSAVPAAAVA